MGNVSENLLSNLDKIIGISKFIVGFCAACAFSYGFFSAIALRLKGKSQHFDFSIIAFWFDTNLLYVLFVTLIVILMLLAVWLRKSHFGELIITDIKQEKENIDIEGEQKINNAQIINIKPRKMGWKIILGGIVVAFSGPCVLLLYRYSSGDLFINWLIIAMASSIFILGGLILIKGFKEYLK